MNFDKFLIQNESTLKAALSNVSPLSEYEKQQVALEQKEGFQYDRTKSYKKKAETRKLSKVLSEAVRTKKILLLLLVNLLCVFSIARKMKRITEGKFLEAIQTQLQHQD